MSDRHRCARADDRGPRGGSMCTPKSDNRHGSRYVMPDGSRVCFAHLPRPLWNQETCTHTPRGGDVCPFCGLVCT